jgi:hypothetical protein
MKTHATLLDPTTIAMQATVLEDVEGIRKANGNRYGKLTGMTPEGKEWKPDKDGQERSFGLSEDNPHVIKFLSIYTEIRKVEDTAVKDLENAMKHHPLGPWVAGQKGLGYKQVGRLLGAVGDPYWRPELVYSDAEGNVLNVIEEGPRSVTSLWAYCGLHVLPGDLSTIDTHDSTVAGQTGDHGTLETLSPSVSGRAARRQKGVKANWSTDAKTRAYLCATSCLKQIVKPCVAFDHNKIWVPQHTDTCVCSPYRVKYDIRRAHTSVTHPEWTDGHRHNDALRVSSKEILKYLWVEARRLHCAFDPSLQAAFDLNNDASPNTKP